MSLAIQTITPEGIVLAADSRQSYRNRKGMARIGSDNASKLVQLNKRIGIVLTGIAFLEEEGIRKNIAKFVEEFKYGSEIEKLNVEEAAEKLSAMFNKKYNWEEQLDRLPEKIRADLQRQGCEVLGIKKEEHVIKFRFKDPQGSDKEGEAGVEMINFMVAGYNEDASHEAYTCYVPGPIQKKRDSKQRGMEYGSNWIGQINVVARIILGYDTRILNVEFVNQAIQKLGQDTINKQLRNLEYVIQWGTMTLQDAIDFCTLMVQTTSAIQRFSDGIAGDPGEIPGVGGPVDVAVITPNNGFVWVNKKKLSFADSEIDL